MNGLPASGKDKPYIWGMFADVGKLGKVVTTRILDGERGIQRSRELTLKRLASWQREGGFCFRNSWMYTGTLERTCGKEN